MGRGKACQIEKCIKLGIKYKLAELRVSGDTITVKYFGHDSASVDAAKSAEISKDLAKVSAYYESRDYLDDLRLTDPLKFEELVANGKLE